MAKPSDYIKLPCIRKIEVRNYTLFEKNLEYEIKTGLNLFIGANGLGKTTTTFLIIYGIVGDNESVNSNYFMQRQHETEIGGERPTVLVDFIIGEKSIVIQRYLDDNKIKNLVIDSIIYNEEESDELEEFYNETLIEYTGIKKTDDIAFLLSKFIIREEEGNYLLWDSMEQAKLLRLLLNVSGFETEFDDISSTLQKFDTRLRDDQNFRAQFMKSQNTLKQNKEELLKKNSGYHSIKDIKKQILNIEEEINKLKFKRQHCIGNINYLTESLKSNDKEIEFVSSEIERKSEAILNSEKEFYSNIYSDEKVLAAVHKLKTYNICIYCNNTPDHDIRDQIIHSVEQGNNCPVCNSVLGEKKIVKKSPKVIINSLNKLKKEIADLQAKLPELHADKNDLQSNLDLTFDEVKEYDKVLNSNSILLYDLRKKHAELESNPEEMITEFDSQIAALQKQIDQYDVLIKDNKASFESEKEKLTQKNDLYNQTINSFGTKLNQIFSKYTSTYFNENCKLVPDEQKPKNFKISLTTYVPQFDNKKRTSKEECSTSERIFLEYIFRLSLIELYYNVTKNPAFLILETSEGAFDISNTHQLGDSLTLFSQKDMPLIIIANFSKPEFISILLSPYSNKNERVLNFLKFGRLSAMQKKSKKEFNDSLAKLNLDRF